MNYKLFKNPEGIIKSVFFGAALQIPFAPDNTDYANFKAQILADEAELQDADGVLMSPEEAKAFVKELP